MIKAFIEEQTAAELAELFRALGDTSRIQMLAALVDGEQNVGALAEQAGISESATSHHLRHLRQMRLVRALGLIKGFTFGKKHLGSPY